MGGVNTTKARELRKNSTEAERTLWRQIRFWQLKGHKFRRQAPIGRYIVDFVCFEEKLIIELDGGQHFEQSAYDSERTAWLGSQGFRVLRFWNDQVLKEIEAVKESILEALENRHDTPHPNLPPQGGKGQKCKAPF
jgi:very-short-patch-repair endonuclease